MHSKKSLRLDLRGTKCKLVDFDSLKIENEVIIDCRDIKLENQLEN